MEKITDSGLEMVELCGLDDEIENQSSRPNEELTTVIIEALQNGNTEEVKDWVSSLPQEERTELINQHTDTEGRKALHIACLHNQLEVAKILLEAGADPGSVSLQLWGMTALHFACEHMCSDNSRNIDELLKILLETGKCNVNAKDDYGETPLHYAALFNHPTTVALLLSSGAKLDSSGRTRRRTVETPVHKAAGKGYVEILSVMIAHDPECVHFKGENDETPLFSAADSRWTKAVEVFLKHGASATVKNLKGKTPLHLACRGIFSSELDPQLVKLLLEAGADPNAITNSHGLYPLLLASVSGNTDVVTLLMDYGAKATALCLERAVTNGYEQTVVALLKCPNWPELLRQTFSPTDRDIYRALTDDDAEKTMTPFRMIIRQMPDVAEDILNRCTIPNPETSNSGDRFYDIVFNYEFIEDFIDSPITDEVNKPGDQASQRKDPSDKETYGVSYNEIQYKCNQKNFSTTWGPVGFNKSTHPLMIMTETSESRKLLDHPLVRSLLFHKWIKFGQFAYFLNLFTYCVFLIFLTTFALLVPNPETDECIAITSGGNNQTLDIEVPCATSVSMRIGGYISAGIVLLFTFCRLLLELLQLITYKLDYLTSWVNWLELVMFVCSIIFVWVFNTQCQCPYNWQWQIGAVAIFLGWFDLVIFFSKFPLTGIYVLMFITILNTFLKVITFSVLLVIAFALSFHMAFGEPSISRSPFSHPGRSILKTMSMTAGDFDFDSIFRQDPTGGGDTLDEIPFPPISYIMWIVFIIFMPVLLTNLLVGLAVGDIQAIQDEATLKKLALQVEQALTTEELLPRRLRRYFITAGGRVYPNNRKTSFLRRFQYKVWGGERFDTHSALKDALQSKTMKTEEPAPSTEPEMDTALLEEINGIKVHNESMKQEFKEQMEELKRKIDLLIQEVTKK